MIDAMLSGDEELIADHPNVQWVPTPEEIAAECLLIQAEWPQGEALRRIIGQTPRMDRADDADRHRRS